MSPDTQAEWDTARDFLAVILRPWVPPAVIPDLVTAYVTGYMTGAGWQPPAQPMPELVRRACERAGDAA